MRSFVSVVEPAQDHSLVSLFEAKIALGIPSSDTSMDDALTLMLERVSGQIATACRRLTFARETVIEVYDTLPAGTYALYLSHYPIWSGGITSVTSNESAVASPSGYLLGSNSGTIMRRQTAWMAPVVVEYTGGYNLPLEAPPSLKQACIVALRTEFTQSQTAGGGEIRMISHKEARVVYQDDPSGAAGGASGISVSSDATLNDLLLPFTRLEI